MVTVSGNSWRSFASFILHGNRRVQWSFPAVTRIIKTPHLTVTISAPRTRNKQPKTQEERTFLASSRSRRPGHRRRHSLQTPPMTRASHRGHLPWSFPVVISMVTRRGHSHWSVPVVARLGHSKWSPVVVILVRQKWPYLVVTRRNPVTTYSRRSFPIVTRPGLPVTGC